MGLRRERVKGGLDLPDFEIMNNAPKVTWLKRLQYCAKVMQTNFDEIPGFSWLFEEISLETILRRNFPAFL